MSSTILVAESDTAICSLVSDILTGQGYRVTTASSREEAVGVLDWLSPDVIFCSAELGEGEGGVFTDSRVKRLGTALVLIVDAATSVPSEEVKRVGCSGLLEKAGGP